MNYQPTYKLTCLDMQRTGCQWTGKFYFDRPRLEKCPHCGSAVRNTNIETHAAKDSAEGEVMTK